MMAKITEESYCDGTRGVAPRHVISGSISTWFDKFFNDGKSDRKKGQTQHPQRSLFQMQMGVFCW